MLSRTAARIVRTFQGRNGVSSTFPLVIPWMTKQDHRRTSVTKFTPAEQLLNYRNFTTSSISHGNENLSYVDSSPTFKMRLIAKAKSARDSVNFFLSQKGELERVALIMYSCCTDPVNHAGFFQVLAMPDTFNSWFKITEMHIWMCSVRLTVEGNTGRYVRNAMIRHFWKDVDTRSLKLGDAVLLNRKKGLRELSDQFRADFFAYDEGLLRDDKVLASAIWRNFYGKQCDDPTKLELLIQYIRTQIDSLDNQDRHNLLNRGIIRWVPISDVK